MSQRCPVRDDERLALFQAIADYWQGYPSPSEAEVPLLRRWSTQTITRGMVERAMRLIDVCIKSVWLPDKAEYEREGDAIYTHAARDWGGIRLSIIGYEGGDTQVLSAKWQSVVLDTSRDCVALCILPSSYIEAWQPFVAHARAEGRFIISVFPADMNALAKGRWSLLELVEYKLYRNILLEKPDIESQYAESLFKEFLQATNVRKSPLFADLKEAVNKLDDSPAAWVDHPELERVVGYAAEGRDCLLVGPSSSGKSVLAFEVGLRLVSRGTQVKFVDVGLVSPQAATRALSLLRDYQTTKKNTLLIYDDLQSSPGVGRFLLTVTRLLRQASSGGRVSILAITWPSYFEEARREIPSVAQVVISPADARRALLAKHEALLTTPDEYAALSAVAKDDVLLWRLLLESPRGRRPSKMELAEALWARRTKAYNGDDASLRRAVLVAALLGQYEFELSEGFLEYQASVSKSAIQSMIKARVLRRTRERLVLGHRSLCILLAQWLAGDARIWAYLSSAGRPAEPVDIIHSYIRNAKVSEVWAILKTLRTQAGLKGTKDLSETAQVLVDAWKLIESLIERIDQQQTIDPTWGRTLSSALFAIEVLCAVGLRSSTKLSVDFMRSFWSPNEGRLLIHPGTAERLDFDEIYKKMKEEDEVVGVSPSCQTADEIDLDRFHDTWGLGLVLCAESAYGERTDQELQELAIAVERAQEPTGYFYPCRVPWVTARVLTGLALCGRSCRNSEVVKMACDWLLTPVKNGGPYRDGLWQSGTGTWNTSLETTSMCVVALVMSGVPHDDPRLMAALTYLNGTQDDWTKPLREIDGALACRAYQVLVGNWQGIIPQVQYLLQWASREAFWDAATRTAKESMAQSCSVAQIAASLVEATWSNLRADLPELLDAFAVLPLTVPEQDSSSAPQSDKAHLPIADVVTERLTPKLDRLREHIKGNIRQQYAEQNERLHSQLDQLRAFQEIVKDKLPRDTEELNTKSIGIEERLGMLDSLFESTSLSLMDAVTEDQINSAYERWQNGISA